MREPALTLAEMQAYLDEVFPEVHHGGRALFLEDLGYGTCRVRMKHHAKNLRPGGTISGPAMMTLADYALYVAVLSTVGKVPLAVTTNLSINFLRKPEVGDLLSETRLLKAGKRLCVGEVTIFSEGRAEPVAHVTGTYSVPPERAPV
ncbi:MAG: phenylacetic acid degradation protein [Methylobacterium sp.]|nr:MAG: phenylacetic acid degradation protein [Methylobacterium sp.]